MTISLIITQIYAFYYEKEEIKEWLRKMRMD